MKKTTRTPATKLRPRANLCKVQAHGKLLLKKFPGDNARGAIKEAAKRLGITPTEFKKLSWAHVQKLLTVKDDGKRQKFAEKATENGWSVHELTCEIEGKLGVGCPGGGQPKPLPKGLQNPGRPPKPRPLSPRTMRELHLEADQMLRLFKAFRDPKSDTLKSPTDQDRPKCKKLLGDVVSRLQDLKEGLEKFTGELEHELRAQKTRKKNSTTVTKTNHARPPKKK